QTYAVREPACRVRCASIPSVCAGIAAISLIYLAISHPEVVTCPRLSCLGYLHAIDGRKRSDEESIGMSKQLLTERDGAVVTITLNLPEARNPISDNMMVDSLVDALQAADGDTSVRAVILTGA